jgi:hypothetical protein
MIPALPHVDDAEAATPMWVLRLGAAACFLGHGALGLTGVAAWASYFGVAGIGPESALSLMPWVGAFDVTLALLLMFRPGRAVVIYMVIWATWTALLRPLAGESFWEVFERAGNYGVPLALLFFFGRGAAGFSDGLRRTPGTDRTIGWILRLTTVLLLLGHGMLNWIVQKPMFVTHYNLLGLPGESAEPLVGMLECLLALAVLIRPTRGLLLGVLAWKLFTEALCPLAGSSGWVFVEHGGSYAAPLALLFLLPRSLFGFHLKPSPAA